MRHDRRSLELRLHDILDEINAILDGTAGLDYDTFSSVWVVRRASEKATRRLLAKIKSAEGRP